MCLISFTDISEPEEESDEETDVESDASESPGMAHFICEHQGPVVSKAFSLNGG